MSSGDLFGELEPGLLGIEIGRNKIRLALLDRSGVHVLDAAERPIAKAGGPRDPIDQDDSTRAALEAALDRIGYTDGRSIVAGASIGFTNCGVGSGPALLGWLESLSDEIREPVVLAGSAGISYAPARCVEFVKTVFKQTGVPLARVELAPVAAARVLRPLRSGALTLGSGIAWSARLLDREVLEAFEVADDPFDDTLNVIVGGVAQPLDELHGIEIDEQLIRNRGVSAVALAPAVGVALSILGPEGSNLLQGRVVQGAKAAAHRGPTRAGLSSSVVTPRGRDHRATGLPAEPFPADRSTEVLTDPETEEEWSVDLDDGDTRQLRRRHDLAAHPVAGSSYDPLEARRPGPDEFDDDLAGIEAFAHAGEESTRGFNVSDFLLGALGMAAIVLLVLLVLG